MMLPPDVGWLAVVGIAAQLLDRSISARNAITASALLVTLTVNLVLSLQLGRLAYAAPLALFLGALAGAPIAAWLKRQLPRRAAVLSVGLVVFAFATAGLVHSLT
jgi:uncharacterized membrane protein YfcA